MSGKILKLLAARDPLPPVEFPNGKVFAVRESDAFLEQLLETAALETSADKFEEAWHYLVPDATPADWARMTTQDYGRLLDHARTNVKATLALVEQNRKNESAGTTASESRTRPSSPISVSSPSSPESPAPSVVTGSSSAPDPTGKRSSRSTRSRKSSASTGSLPTSTP